MYLCIGFLEEIIMENSMKLIMLGTGNAAVVNCYNTCFALCRGEKFFWWMREEATVSCSSFRKPIYL